MLYEIRIDKFRTGKMETRCSQEYPVTHCGIVLDRSRHIFEFSFIFMVEERKNSNHDLIGIFWFVFGNNNTLFRFFTYSKQESSENYPDGWEKMYLLFHSLEKLCHYKHNDPYGIIYKAFNNNPQGLPFSSLYRDRNRNDPVRIQVFNCPETGYSEIEKR